MDISAAKQAAALKGRFRDSRTGLDRTGLTWTGNLQPTELSREYTVQIRYKPPLPPRVRVLSDLPSREGEPYPHTYRDGSLCLYKAGEWSAEMLIADTIVPWASEWLIHYEIWLATGKWYGGGEEVA